MILKKSVWACIMLACAQLAAHAQSIPVGSTALDDYYRRQQLLNGTDSLTSFTARPFFPDTRNRNVFYPDNTEKNFNKLDPATTYQSVNGKFSIMLLPLQLQTQINSDHPYGWNDGAMIPARGLQTMGSAGFFAKYGILTVQFRPEIVLAANSDFDAFNTNHYEVIAARYYDIYNNIDLPVRFGLNPYARVYWGQSSIRLNYKSLSFGLSTENLWWGPGLRNSLLMSNSAPGFKHLTLNTTKPIQTPIGSFEGQFIAGRLENSGYDPLAPGRTFFGNPLYVPKPTDWRYLSGLVITWQPKWVPGLFFGLTRSAQTYSKDLSGLSSYLPFFAPYRKVSAEDPINKRDERSSIFTRWVWKQEQAEVYFEYGTNNNTNTLRNTFLNPQDARAYIFGLRKILPFNRSRNENIMISVEATQMAETSVDKIVAGNEWYVNSYVRQGYTNRGESLGAGIGPGANLQTLDISWFKGLKKIGLQFERYLHNDDFYYYAYYDSGDTRRHWVDLSIGATGEWNYKNFIFNAKILGVQSINYQWYLIQHPEDPYWVDGKIAYNLQVQAGLTYRF
ncbi:capsule assembly Wzi family protein [Mucilaginibacter robiniae]|uniref:Capsule assembly Wzi family protein n=1 Tax=Mucilaginibacter robiniae TaxID=2728022 RepID=A0A7L5E4L8_9SPHI|nr:capsule assembly Wzi family protein [Mucilaginibacter robiniae]QJD97548.1 capsule assembly Wzi family protein [Mucilaginibacter robiniae]